MPDNMGRVLMANNPDISMFKATMDVHHWNAGDRRTINLAMLVLFTVLSTVTSILRVYTRTRIIKAFGADDWAMLISQVAFYIYLGFQIAEVVYGTGLHRNQLTLHNAEMGLKYWYCCAVAYALATSLIKISIGLFLLRFTTHRIQTFLVWLINIAAAVIGKAYFIFLLLTCHPQSFFWVLDPTVTGYCFSSARWLNVGYFVSACNTLADLVFAVIPIFIVWGTSMNLKTKAGVSVLLGMGSIAVLATIIRIVYGHTFNEYKGEFLHETSPIAITSTIELGLGVSAANIATFRPLFRAWMSRAGLRRERDHSGQTNIRWVKPFNSDEAGKGLKRSKVFANSANVSPSGSQKTIKSVNISHMETVDDMPDLVFAKEEEDDLEKGLSESSHRLQSINIGKPGHESMSKLPDLVFLQVIDEDEKSGKR